MSNLWTVKETADYLNMRERSVRRLIYRGKLAGVRRIGFTIRVDPDELRAAMKEQAGTVTPTVTPIREGSQS